MPDRDQFAALRNELLRGGVSPLYVERTIREIGDHYEDLENAAVASGLSPEDAARRALEVLGRTETIAAAVLARRELLSWSHRWPALALFVRSAGAIGALPVIPLLYIMRSQELHRWGGALASASVLVGLLLSGLNWMIVVT